MADRVERRHATFPRLGRLAPRLVDRPPYELLRDAWPVLPNLGEPGDLDITPWTDRVHLVDASHDDRWELLLIGEVDETFDP